MLHGQQEPLQLIALQQQIKIILEALSKQAIQLIKQHQQLH